jgi:hypothetical protein
MRSVCFHLVDVTRKQVAGFLSTIADSNGIDEWCLPRGSESPTLFLDFYDELESQADPKELAVLKATFGRMPDVVVMVTISPRIAGDAEVASLANVLLQTFRGTVWDDYTTHCWTLDQIKSGTKVFGHPFFDYAGWQKKAQPSSPAA